MKLLIVTCIREDEREVRKIFHQTGIKLFSVLNARGIKDEPDTNLLDDWFGNQDGETDARVLFSFSMPEAAKHCITLINELNQMLDKSFPIRAFMLSVEERTNQII